MKQGAALLFLLFGMSAWGHPAHVSMAEMNWNAQRSVLEVALSLAPEDLSAALRHWQGRPVALAVSPQFEALVQELTALRFQVLGPQGQPLPQRYVGLELSHQAVWIYFEVVVSQARQRLSLRHSWLLALHPQQVNTVVLSNAGDRRTLSFRRGAEVVEIGLLNSVAE